MKLKLLLMLLIIYLVVFGQGRVEAQMINVFQAGTLLGTVNPYAGSYSGKANYHYYNYSEHVYIGPSYRAEDAGELFFYNGSDGLHFNMIFGHYGTNSSTWRYVTWKINVSGSSTDPVVQVTDDANELKEVSTTNVFNGIWSYYSKFGDGGVIGPISGNNWVITVNPSKYTYINSLKVYDNSGSSISLAINTTDDIVFKPVPEPSSILLLLAGLMGGAFVVRRKRR